MQALGTLDVLVVDDEPAQRTLMRYLLQDSDLAGLDVREAGSARAAREAVAADVPDVLLLDQHLPDQEGLQLAVELLGQAPEIIVILVTGDPDPELDVAAEQAGIADFLGRDEVTPTVLGRAIRYAVRRREDARALRAGERRLRDVVASVTDSGVLACDLEHRIHTMEGVAFRQPGWREHLGTDVRDFLRRIDRQNLLEHMEAALTGQVVETDLVSAARRIFTIRFTPTRDDAGTITGAIGISRDVTHDRALELDRERDRHSLDEARERFHVAFESAAAGFTLSSLDGVLLECNEAYAAMLGRSREDVCGRTIASLTHPEDLAETVDYVRGVQEGGTQALHIEKRFLHADGRAVPAIVAVGVVRGQDGRPRFMTAQTIDLTASKRAEEDLQRAREAMETSNLQLLAAQRLASMGSYVVDVPSGRIAWSPGLHELVGIPEEEFDGTREAMARNVHPDDRAATLAAVERATLRGEDVDLEHRLLVGAQVRWVRTRRQTIRDDEGAPSQVVVAVQDITQDVELRRSLQEAQRLACVGSWAVDLATGIPSWSEEMHRLVWVPVDAPAPRLEGYLRRVHPDDREQVVAEFGALLGEGRPFDAEHRLVGPGGEVRHVRARGRAESGLDGTPVRVYGTTQDITVERGAEELLRAERDRSAAMLAAMGEGLVMTRQGVVVDVNDAMCRLTGWSREQLVGAGHPLPWVPPESQRAVSAAVQVLREDGSLEVELVLQRADASRWDGLARTKSLRDAEGAIVGHVTTIRDVTVERRQERALQELARTDALTGLPNRRAFEEALGREVAHARRTGRPLTLVLLDLDHFKAVNDRHGHPIGDRVLRETAERLADVVRAGEFIARLGGEEFAWLLPDADGPGALAAAERARSAIGAFGFEGVGTVTVSVGMCELSGADGNADALYAAADRALYWAKHHGRNTVFRYTPEVAEALAGDPAAGDADRQRARQASTIRALAQVVDRKQEASGGHSRRVGELSYRLAIHAGWTPRRAGALRDAALVHDVGKIALDDAILLKPGRLDDDERVLIQGHPVLGAQLAAGVLDPEQVRWVRHHHERFDGGGYPDALGGEAIPAGARMLALADAFDAMTHVRVYQQPRTPGEALGELVAGAGSQFDPALVDQLTEVLSLEQPASA